MGAVDIAPLASLAIYSEATSNIYLDPLPVSYSIRVSHPDEQELAVTVVVGNSATGGFAYQTYNSQACSQATASIPTWDQILPVAERFELVMNDEAVLDRETGLVWERDTVDNMRDWIDALSYCYQNVIGGRGGWRLPTIAELRTLVDTTQFNPALPAGHLFTNVKRAGYWSSTTFADVISYAWYISLPNGGAYSSPKTHDIYYVRAVRSGQ